jgi:magnesium chelatase family protein
MTSRRIKKHCKIDDASCDLLESAIDKLGLSARAYNRILKTVRKVLTNPSISDYGIWPWKLVATES